VAGAAIKTQSAQRRRERQRSFLNEFFIGTESFAPGSKRWPAALFENLRRTSPRIYQGLNNRLIGPSVEGKFVKGSLA
jgi:hypothetical protein